MKKETMKVTENVKTAQEKSVMLDKVLAEVGGMTAKQLVTYAHDEHGVVLRLDNGRTWLLRKVSYLSQEKVKGLLTGRAAENAAILETPKKIAELKTEDKYHEKEVGSMKTKSVVYIKDGAVKDNRAQPATTKHAEGRLDKAAKLTVLVKGNPKRVGSKAHKAFALYGGCKIAQNYIDAGGTLAELRWDIARGFIAVGN